MFKKIIFAFIVLSLAILPFAAPTHAFGGFATDWDTIQSDATIIHDQALTLEQEAFQMTQMAQTIQLTETDPEIVALAGDIIDMAGQIEQDAAAIAVTADDINVRINNSEGTTLALSDDIGEMANRIGEMADRILWTELQIGVMSDRIVESEYLISDSTLSLVNEMQETNSTMTSQTKILQAADQDILQELAF
jgi:TolA-binding protein